MGTRITFVAGLAVGYVLGSKAGRERYEQLAKATRSFVDSTPVQSAGHAAAGFGRDASGKAVQKIGEHLPERVGRHLRHDGHSHNGSSAHGRYDDGL
ncbi:YtxH domain-containing protein [Yinghuangia aomiensis]|uniref:YtxH domain-containing protein n=1 Tax=Yinghuangia aomiensis TaxID=676205 RepID=A0ABP9GKI6_9ACTN